MSSQTWGGKGYLYFALRVVLLCEWCCFEVASENDQYHTLSSIVETQINKICILPTKWL